MDSHPVGCRLQKYASINPFSTVELAVVVASQRAEIPLGSQLLAIQRCSVERSTFAQTMAELKACRCPMVLTFSAVPTVGGNYGNISGDVLAMRLRWSRRLPLFLLSALLAAALFVFVRRVATLLGYSTRLADNVAQFVVLLPVSVLYLQRKTTLRGTTSREGLSFGALQGRGSDNSGKQTSCSASNEDGRRSKLD